MKSIQSEGKNVSQAIEKGLSQLGLSREDVNIQVLEVGGLLKKAKVLITADGIEDIKTEKFDIADDDELDIKALLKGEKKEIKEEISQNINLNNNEDLKLEDNNILEDVQSANEKLEEVVEREIYEGNGADIGIKFLKELFVKMGANCDAKVYKVDGGIEFDINGDDVNLIIGNHGDTLSAIQYIVGVLLNRAEVDCGKVFVNAGSYKQKREKSLIGLANRMAHRVAKTKRSMKLEPMNAYERKIIHTALQNDGYVKTISKGEEPRRCVVILLK